MIDKNKVTKIIANGRVARLLTVIFKTNIPLVQYLVLAVAQLPFSLQEEPLYLIYNINHVTSLTSAELLTSLKEKHNNGM